MKTLIIYSNETIFPEAPDFYKFVAEKEGKLKEYTILHTKIVETEQKDPSLPTPVSQIVEGILAGIEVSILKSYIEEYIRKYAHPDLELLGEKGHDTILMGSYPAMLYQMLPIEAFSIGVDLDIKESTIQSFKPIVLYNPERVKDEMARLGFVDFFTVEPNRYGNLERLIDHIIEEGLSKDECALIAGNKYAEPTKKYIETHLSDEEIEELLSDF